MVKRATGLDSAGTSGYHRRQPAPKRREGVHMKCLIPILAAFCVMLAGCNENGPLAGAGMVSAPAGAAPVALLSLEGAPTEVTARLAGALAREAETRSIALVPGSGTPRYKLKGYLAAAPGAGGSVVTWIWDVFDGTRQRTQRLEGTEEVRGTDAWQAIDDAAINRIAGHSMDGVARFLGESGAGDAIATNRLSPQPALPQAALGFAATE